MLLEGLILTSVVKIEASRTINSIFYLLVGKRSVQTVQDAHLYHTAAFFGIYHTLTKEQFDATVEQLSAAGKLQAAPYLDNSFTITTAGEKWLTDHQTSIPYPYYNGMKYIESDRIFYRRLLLLTQVLTNRKMNEAAYIPVIDQPEIIRWVTYVYQDLKTDVDAALAQLYSELYQLLKQVTEKEALIFVSRLTGYKQYGMSLNQLAAAHQMSVSDVQLLLVGIIHKMLTIITNQLEHFPLLSRLLEDLSLTGFLSQSATRTKALLARGYDLKTIAKLRRLKMNTIYDHLVEIALADPVFSIAPYVSKQAQDEIIAAYHLLNSSKLKDIKAYVDETISYFQIRLVLALSEQEKGEMQRD